MSIDERYNYLSIKYDEYQVAKTRQEKSAILDEIVKVTGLDRKVVIRLMKKRPQRKRRRKQRSCTYGAAVQDAIHLIAKALDYPCPERLKPMLPWMLDHLAQHGRLEATPELRQQLESVSISTVGRIRARRQQDQPRLRRRRRSAAANAVQAQIPIRRIPWDTTEPGRFEVDLVYHSGPSTSGEFVYTLQMVDVYTGWVESAAMLGRSFRVTRDAFLRCLARLPFPVHELQMDNGPEFMNHHLFRFWCEHYPQVDLSRIRPYKKQDNRFVEQRNGALVRALVGHDRLDTVAQTLLLNRLYERVWVYHNLFQPVMRQTEKTYVQGRVCRKHDDVRTPFQRVCAAGVLSTDRQRELAQLLQDTDPLTLREEIHDLILRLLALPGAQPGHSEHVFDTLAFPDIA